MIATARLMFVLGALLFPAGSASAQTARSRTLPPATPALERGPCGTGAFVETLPAATAGTMGRARLDVKGKPILGGGVGVQVTEGLPGAPGILFFQDAEAPVFLEPFQAFFYPGFPARQRSFVLDAAGESNLIGLTDVPVLLCGRERTVQAVFLDPLAPGGVAFTDAKRLTFGDPNDAFLVTSISVPPGAAFPLNGAISVSFNRAVDFSSVSFNTLRVESTDGVPATGSFLLTSPRTVVFQPACPREPDLSDAGLQPGGVSYVLTVVGASSGGANTIRSATGEALAVTRTRAFTTPVEPDQLFVDTAFGPPVPVVRGVGSADLDASYIEVGGDPGFRVYFELDPGMEPALSDPAFRSPLNLYSVPGSRIAVLLELNQAVSPVPANLSQERVRLEFLDAADVWQPLGTKVELVANCTATGARLRLEPVGILPAETELRVAILPGFQDLVGETNLLTIDDFALFPTRTVAFTSLDPTRADDLSDEVLEGFELDGLQDVDAPLATPPAVWSDGKLTAAFDFAGTGGPGGNFDWVVTTGTIFFFDTTSQLVIGGPGGIPVAQQLVVNGVLDVRDVVIEEGAEVRVMGPNPLQINASGTVEVHGEIDLSGFDARNVATLNTGNQPEIGAAGVAGGGRGGNSSEVTTDSTPRGGAGQGPFGLVGAGGQGGESGFAPKALGKDARRPGGGGGGRFASDARLLADFDMDGSPDSEFSPETASDGFPGHPQSTGALTNLSPAEGGAASAGPFQDGDDENDFFGLRAIPDGRGGVERVIRGELAQPVGGSGGGGAGDALPSSGFPTPSWNPGSDEKGGPGGGAAGVLRIRALEAIVIGAQGQILAKGGRGGTGENTLFLDHVGGTGGSASGGHVILESAERVVFEGLSAVPGGGAIDARGGPLVRGPTAGVPANVSYGGSGGAGVIQLHVPDPLDPVGVTPADEIQVPPLAVGVNDDVTLNNLVSPAPYVLVPTFGARSTARSRWIPLGEASFDADDATPDLVRFVFGGVTPDATGRVLDGDANGDVDELPPLLDELVNGTSVAIRPDGLALLVSGTALAPLATGTTDGVSNDLYLRTPALLRNFVLRLQDANAPSPPVDFEVAAASYDEGSAVLGDELLTLEIAAGGPTLLDVGPGPQRALLVPRFFVVETDGVPNALSPTTFVNVRFQAARDDGTGNPDAANPVVDFTGDVSAFNAAPPGEIRFFRFEVEFDLSGGGTVPLSADTEPVALDFLRLPFLF